MMTPPPSNLRSSVTSLAAKLVQSPSQAGLESIDGVAAVVSTWCTANGLLLERIESNQDLAGLLIRIGQNAPGSPTILLNACLDTAEFGDCSRWEHPPNSGLVIGDWLYGRGSADCKIAVSIFLHLAQEFQHSRELRGQLLVYFDGDEHTGAMRGIREFRRREQSVDFAMIGYPGRDKVFIGARGFLRLRIVVYGQSSHSGAKSVSLQNAVVKSARLVTKLSLQELGSTAGTSDMRPKLTVTGIDGGGAFALVPDKCAVLVDIRLTEDFGVEAARTIIEKLAAETDGEFPTGNSTEIVEVHALPAYSLSADNPLTCALSKAAQAEFGSSVGSDICGPSNVGNFLAAEQIPATCGFGVRYRGIHAPDECAFLPDIEPIFRVYRETVKTLDRTVRRC